ncbi:MAG: peptidoglycan DD-metalloendopeptidase family protein [Halieaceae bacterium]|nr:peptidoglycan DD-metalloendopeptidase family protein [Halieaceae bacterium]
MSTRRKLCRAGLAPLLLLLLAGFLPRAIGQGDDAAQTRERLAELERSIKALSAAQRRDEERRGETVTSLRAAEASMARLSSALRTTRSEIGAAREEIETLRQQRDELLDNSAAQQDAVRRELRRAYQHGGRDELRLLLSEDDPQRVARMLAYYRRVAGARRSLIEGFRDTLAELSRVEDSLSERERSLDEQLARQQEQLAELEGARAQRRQLLATIESRLASQAASIEAQQAERSDLEALLEEIEAVAARLEAEKNVEAFSAAQGRMPWPVDGNISHAFGRPRAQGKLRWQGVRMRAEAGSTVSAIHHGRVVYADWLRGSGLLLVIDHGEGFMSLYAHNESLLRDVGDWVNTGAAVATVGSTGGQSETALYFEIRKDGKPVDPARWCRG